ncbi:4Fe-4S binding protein [Desulfoluna sp.]|uniref:4Fe-4S binding protein n=1 Tax=Desulfoluna sp. TaxID=2045199 RepID=UPI0026166B72|nr:4Fe-4S binding protein [Desulfoluna sp.]
MTTDISYQQLTDKFLLTGPPSAQVNPELCIHCGLFASACPQGAIALITTRPTLFIP